MNTKLIIGVIIALALILGLVVVLRRARPTTQASVNSNPSNIVTVDTQNANAVALAKAAYQKAKSEGKDLEQGPCLGTIAPDWVADITHEPRQAVDNLKENQCEDFITGKVHHFVELDVQGNVIRAL